MIEDDWEKFGCAVFKHSANFIASPYSAKNNQQKKFKVQKLEYVNLLSEQKVEAANMAGLEDTQQERLAKFRIALQKLLDKTLTKGDAW